MIYHHRAISGGEYEWMRQRLETIIHCDESLGVSGQSCVAEPLRRRRLRGPQQHVMRHPQATLANHLARRDLDDLLVGVHCYATPGENARIPLPHGVTVRWQYRRCRG